MIKGIGTDIIEISRIESAVEKEKFINEIYTKDEIEEFKKRKENITYLAGHFAAKEAVSKALGTGMRGISFSDIEILSDELGKPFVKIKKNGYENYIIHISISHSKENAIAFCVIENKQEEN